MEIYYFLEGFRLSIRAHSQVTYLFIISCMDQKLNYPGTGTYIGLIPTRNYSRGGGYAAKNRFMGVCPGISVISRVRRIARRIDQTVSWKSGIHSPM